MIRTQVYLPEHLYQRAKMYAQLNAMSISEVLRHGLTTALEVAPRVKKNPLENMVGIFSDVSADAYAAEDHNNIYEL